MVIDEAAGSAIGQIVDIHLENVHVDVSFA